MIDRRALQFEMPGRRRRAVLSLAPLIDVIFILLIFFMLVTQFERFAPVDVTLGSAREISNIRSAGIAGGQDRLTLDIKADGAIRFEGRGVVSLDELPGILRQEAESTAGTGSGFPVIAIAPEPDVPLQLLLDVLNVVQQHPSMTSQIIVPGRKEGPAE